ncbi:MAG: LLM class flavin-dependent oxidoreductase [Micrococcaceae bacterium]
MTTPLSVFDLTPVPAGATAADAVTHSVELARRAEQAGYHRLWYGEHHLNPGIVGTSPALFIALAAGVTSRLRLGSGAVLAGHRSALTIAEEFAVLEAVAPGRIDLGLGRAGLRGAKGAAEPAAVPRDDRWTPEGLLLPGSPDLSGLFTSPRFAAQRALLNPAPETLPTYAEFVDQLQDFFAHRGRSGDVSVDAVHRSVRAPQLWILGSSPGESAQIAAERGLPFAANYHVAPSQVIDAIDHYRSGFRPGVLAEPAVLVSAEVLAAGTEAEAQRLGRGYGAWVHSIRTGSGAIPYPAPEDEASAPLSGADADLVADREATRFLGTPEQVARQLAVLREATGADELLLSTITHDPQARIRSYELLAEAWAALAPHPTPATL